MNASVVTGMLATLLGDIRPTEDVLSELGLTFASAVIVPLVSADLTVVEAIDAARMLLELGREPEALEIGLAALAACVVGRPLGTQRRWTTSPQS